MNKSMFVKIEKSDCELSKSIEKRRKLKTKEINNITID